MSDMDDSVRVCPNCAGSVYGRFCPTCGIDLENPSDNPWAEAPEGGAFRAEDFQHVEEGPPGPRQRAPVLAILAGVFVTAIVAALGVGALNSGVTGIGVATTTSSTEVPATDLPTSAPPSLTPTRPTTGSSSSSSTDEGLPSGLFCRDLFARGVSYPDAVTYWQRQGTPGRMDADGNDIPCETVYPREQVIAFWGEIGWDSAGGYLGSLPSGLYCRDLAARKLDYPEAVAYWLSQGMPDRMDEDLNGIPCETVYDPEVVSRYWNN